MTGKMRQFWVFGYGSLMWRPGFPHLPRRAGADSWLPSPSMRLFACPSRHAGTARPGARPRSRRLLPRHCVRGRDSETARRRLPICGLASRSRRSIAKSSRRCACLRRNRGPSKRSPMWSIARISNMPGRCRSMHSSAYVRQGNGQSGDCEEYVHEHACAFARDGDPRPSARKPGGPAWPKAIGLSGKH